MTHQRLPRTLLQQLVALAHARRAAGREHEPGDRRRLPLARRARLRPRDDLHQQPADAHRLDIGAAEPGMPARQRCSTQSKPFSLGERAQPGAPITGLPPSSPTAGDCRDRPACRDARCARRPRAAPAASTSRRSVMAEAPKTTTISAGPWPQPHGSRRPAARPDAARGDRPTMVAPAGCEPLGHHLQRLVDDGRLQTRQQRRDHRRPSLGDTARPRSA